MLKNKSVRFPEASKHHKKVAQHAIKALGSRIHPMSKPWYFQIEAEVFEQLLSSLKENLKRHFRTNRSPYDLLSEIGDVPFVRSADDVIAMALFEVAAPKHPYPDVEADCVWNANRPILESWDGVRFVNGKPHGRSIPAQSEHVMELAAGGRLVYPETLFQRPRLKIDWQLSFESSQLPTLEMKIQGAPLGRLYFNGGKLHATIDQRRAALDVLEPAFNFLLKQLGALREDNHRPRTPNDFHAAVLHFHFGFPWKEVAKKLCHVPHEHDAECEVKCIQAAKRYYKQVKDKLRRD